MDTTSKPLGEVGQKLFQLGLGEGDSDVPLDLQGGGRGHYSQTPQ